jgi:hypothetical protein
VSEHSILLNSDRDVQVCDATEAEKRCERRFKKKPSSNSTATPGNIRAMQIVSGSDKNTD